MSWWRSAFYRRNSDLDEEIQSHIAMAVQDRIDRGESAEDARASVMREFGNLPLVKDVVHEMWGRDWFDRLAQDLRFALRQLRKSPGFTVTVVATVALAIGANTAIFSLAYALLLRSLPIHRPEQLVQFKLRTLDPEPNAYLTSGLYEEVKRSPAFSGVCAWEGYGFSGEQGGDGRGIPAAKVSADCFATLGIQPTAGRLLTPDDDRTSSQAVVISYAWWETRFQRDPGVIGKRLVMMTPFLNQSVPVTIVGVLPKSFQSLIVSDAPAIVVPMGQERSNFSQDVLIFARLKDKITVRQAEQQIQPAFRAWVASLPPSQRQEWVDPKGNRHIEVSPSKTGYSYLGLLYKKPLILLQTLVAVLLLASCAYLGTLLSARSIARRREIALRAALGASRGRLIRQLFSESLLLAVGGSSAGVLFAWIASRFLLTFVQSDPGPSNLSAGPGRDVLLFTLGITMLAVVIWGLIPAIRASRVAILPDMKSGTGGSFHSGAPRRVGRWLVPFQIALSLLIVVVAGLLSTTLVRLLAQNNGYRLHGTVFASTDFPITFGKEASARIAAEIELQRIVLDRLNHTPGIPAASVGMVHVLGGASYLDFFRTAPSGGSPDYKSETIWNAIGPRYFGIMGTSIIKGRDFAETDTAASQPVCILTRAAERHFFPQSNAVGRTLYQPQGKDAVKALRVIGVVDDMRYGDLRKEAPPIVYFDFTQMGEARNMEFVMRTDDPASAIASLRDILRTMAPGVHVTRSITMEDQVGQSLARERLLATLSNFFAGLGLLLGAISLYGVLSYSVNCRRAEIGVRMALGASRGNVIRLFVSEAARLVIPGLIGGAIVCLAVTRLLGSLLYQTKPLDLATTTLSVVAILATALVASWLPAHRASTIDPMQALRAE